MEKINLPVYGDISVFNKKPPQSKVAHVVTSTMINEIYISKINKIIKWYKNKWNMPWDVIVLNDGLNVDTIQDLVQNTDCTVIAFEEHLGRAKRTMSLSDYPYEWRNLNYIKILLQNYDKVIFMANDVYILNSEMVYYLDTKNEGWIGFWFPAGNHPESAIQIINKGCLEYNDFVNNHENFMAISPHTMYEWYVPFTCIEKKFKGIRYDSGPLNVENLDFIVQAQLQHEFL